LLPVGASAKIRRIVKVAFLASEVAPYAKTGGLADVAGALPKYLARLGAEVKVFMPLYRETRAKGLPLLKAATDLTLDWDGGQAVFSVWEEPTAKVTAYFIEKNDYFERDGLYGASAGDFSDNGERFAFFSRSALEALKALDFAPDVLHVHDWQAALTLAYLKFIYGDDPFFKKTKSLFTIHNLAYQGLFDPGILKRVGLPEKLYEMDALEYYGKVNFLKAGLLYSSAINTVSPRYSREIQTPEFSCGLDGLLRERRDVVSGILNGADYSAWNPAADAFIVRPYTAGDLGGKAACRSGLLAAFGLPAIKKDPPVIGMVSRLAGQKGLDILVEALGGLFGLGVRLVILGAGEAKIENDLRAAAGRYPSFFRLRIAFDESLAHKIYAGSDMFLIPSRYEPCGLTQMYSLKYGTVPIVRATGGLDDSIQEFDPAAGAGNGFKFAEAEPSALLGAVRRAVSLYGQPPVWTNLVRNAMACDFSWERAAAEYLGLYRKIVG
jgi:starch synthase